MKLSGKKILIVDDDSSLRILLKRILNNVGCEVFQASDLWSALKIIQEESLDLIILDLNMPEHSGFALLKYRLNNPQLKKLPVLVLSGVTQAAIVQKAVSMGANQYVQKPLRANVILQRIRILVNDEDEFVYRFPENKRPKVGARIFATVSEVAQSRVKVSTGVKFAPSKPTLLMIENYQNDGGQPLVNKVDNRMIAIEEGNYQQILKLVGLDQNERSSWLQWLKKMRRTGR